MNLEWIFFAVRLYTVVITFGAALVIWLYARLVQNPSFGAFVRKFWVLLVWLGIQGTMAIFQAQFPYTPENVIFVIVTGMIKMWIFVGYLLLYLQQLNKTSAVIDDKDPTALANRGLDILDYH